MAYPQQVSEAADVSAARPRPFIRAAILAAVVLAASASPPRAEQTADAGAGEPSLSMECRVPGAQLYTAAKLGAVRAALAEKRPIKLLAIGGSAAPGASASYPAKLEAALEQALPKVDVVIDHRGLPGEVASGAAERLRTMVVEAEPDLVVWQVGTHDAIARVEADAFESALSEAVAWIKSHGIDVVLVDPIYTASMAADADYNRIVEAVRTVATQQQVPLVRRYEALHYLSSRSDRGEGHMLGRQFRLNDLGLRCMAEHVALTIVTSLAKTETPAEPKAAPAVPPLTGTQRAPG
ncbi:GDSL-type esterase/lipase family protein [Methylobacterium sp. J-030]|uniref:SGNH/GDSL hydrolase family protein n=1 Tax=Methylobacterium sp. J-030 TaxID=2836627 RepID=UPI001FBA89D5|nr:GDSL-type esterase/lipase family protein [Methylobacterium sp. J-030]MCJ2068230.1 GDSL-type esterase/lipase family protein [Methylobacterium sp. J-030]